jgi:hypothetical protein
MGPKEIADPGKVFSLGDPLPVLLIALALIPGRGDIGLACIR